ncbi:MAG: MerR family transcriptional regulator [Actinomycetota bacterium]|nr:MAG: MerR family transcriptional regulator [Acidimicrobiaceae bacterium]
MSSVLSSSWSIDELAALVGVPTRTVREYRTLGVIDPPRKEGRVGRYDESHRRRLELIARLQDRGYSLAAIRDLCAASESGRSLDDVLGGAGSAAIDEGAVAYSTDALFNAVPAFADETLRDSAIEVGLIAAKGDEWHVRAPSLLALVGDAIASGADPAGVMTMVAGLVVGARVQASAFAEMVVGELWNEASPAVAELVSAGRRARLQLTQAVASLVVHEVGVRLRALAAEPGGGGLDALVDGLRVGVVRGRSSNAG